MIHEEKLIRVIKEMKNNILKKLYPYKDNSYFNLFFYDIAKKLDGIVLWFRYEELMKSNRCNEYSIICKMLIDICINIDIKKETYINYINNLIYQLTHFNLDNDIINDIIVQSDNLLEADYCSIVTISYKEHIVKQYTMYIDIDIINCVDYSDDLINFKYIGNTIKGMIKAKNIYTINDTKILNIMCSYWYNPIRTHGYEIIIEYCIRIINYQDGLLIYTLITQFNIYFIINMMIDLLNNNVFTEQSIIFNNQLFIDILIKLIKHLVVFNEAIFSLIEKIPFKYYKYINKSLLKKFLKILKKDKKNIEQYFGYIVKITSFLNA